MNCMLAVDFQNAGVSRNPQDGWHFGFGGYGVTSGNKI